MSVLAYWVVALSAARWGGKSPLLASVGGALWLLHASSTEAHVGWAAFRAFQQGDIRGAGGVSVLSDVATRQNVGASTQTQTLAPSLVTARVLHRSRGAHDDEGPNRRPMRLRTHNLERLTPDVEHGEKNIVHASQRA